MTCDRFASLGNKTILFPALLLVWASVGCGVPQADTANSTADPSRQPLAVATEEVREALVDRRAEVVGTLLAKEQTVLTSMMSGTVRQVRVDFGSRASKGQILVALDSREPQIAVQRAEAALAESLAILGLPPAGSEDAIDLNETPAVAEAAAMLADGRTKLESAAQLIETRDIPEQRYWELQRAVQMREAALRSSQDLARAQVAAVKSRRAELALARKRLGDTQVFAPFDGSVVERHVSVGEFVREDAPLVTLAQTNPLRLRARIPETGAAAARSGVALTFRTDAYPNRDFSAVVTDVSPVLDPASRTLVAEAMVDNAEGLLKPGMFARISLLAAPNAKAVMVPKSAVLRFGGLNKIFVVKADGSIEERSIQTGLETGDLVEILNGGAAPGEKVATSLLDQLSPGVKVKAG